jgi:hypothetical protein
MGARGPIGKNKEAKAGHRTKAELEEIEVIDLDEIDPEVLERAKTGMIPADEDWHEVARIWYESLAESGQRLEYQPSDWAVAYVLAESMSRDLFPQVIGITEEGEIKRAAIPLKGASLAAYLKGFTALGATVGDRKRMGMELERGSNKGKGKDEPTGDGVVLNRAEMFQKGGQG